MKAPASPARDPRRDAYYAEAGSWAADRHDSLRASRRLAWIIATIAISLAFLEALSITLLVPLKTVVPLTLLVDRHTGYVEALKDLKPGTVSADTALTQSFLVQYVIARESFDMSDIRPQYRKVALWSAQAARSDYLGLMNADNPQSPLNLYPHTSLVETRIKSVTPMTAQSAMVRFDTRRQDADGRAYPAENWVAVIDFHYSGMPMAQEDRYINPLGFQVLRYRRSAESLTPPVNFVAELPTSAEPQP